MPVLEDYDEPVFNAMKRVFESGRNTGHRLGPAKLREMIIRRNDLQKKYLDRWMATQESAERPMDGIIWPVSPTAANRLRFAEEVQYVGYTSFANILGNFPLFSCLFLNFAELPFPFGGEFITNNVTSLRTPIMHVPGDIRRQIARRETWQRLEPTQRPG
jgi:hypothetical protein